jgi:hypothetical protein
MKKAIAILAVLSIAAFAGEIVVNLGPTPEKDADWLQYDNGSAWWLTWGGMYRGVWFNAEDFTTESVSSVGIQQAELWFYHSSSRPWDISDFYCEIWNGDAMGPVTQLDQTLITAIHYSPVYADYSPEMIAEPNFWCLINTEMSAGGWPSVLGDSIASSAENSFFSDDFIVWEPWGMGNYFIRIYADVPYYSIDNTTWGSLKATF